MNILISDIPDKKYTNVSDGLPISGVPVMVRVGEGKVKILYMYGSYWYKYGADDYEPEMDSLVVNSISWRYVSDDELDAIDKYLSRQEVLIDMDKIKDLIKK